MNSTENEITKAAEEKAVAFPPAMKENDLQPASTEQGEAFTALVRLMLKQTGLTRLLWGKVFESESKVVLLLGECHECPIIASVGALIWYHSSQIGRPQMPAKECRARRHSSKPGKSWRRISDVPFTARYSIFGTRICGTNASRHTTCVHTGRHSTCGVSLLRSATTRCPLPHRPPTRLQWCREVGKCTGCTSALECCRDGEEA